MSKYIPGNQTHLTLEDRIHIENSLNKDSIIKFKVPPSLASHIFCWTVPLGRFRKESTITSASCFQSSALEDGSGIEVFAHWIISFNITCAASAMLAVISLYN